MSHRDFKIRRRDPTGQGAEFEQNLTNDSAGPNIENDQPANNSTQGANGGKAKRSIGGLHF